MFSKLITLGAYILCNGVINGQNQTPESVATAQLAEHIANTMGAEFRVIYYGPSNEFQVTSNRPVKGVFRSLNPNDVATSIFPSISIKITTYLRPTEWSQTVTSLKIADLKCRQEVAKFAGANAFETYRRVAPKNSEEWLALITGEQVSYQLSSLPTHYFKNQGLLVDASHLVTANDAGDTLAQAIERRFTELICTFVEYR